MLVFCIGLIRTAISPDDEIAYENRPAEKLLPLSAESYMDKSFQDSAENSLSDQVNAAIKMKKLYNIIDTAAALPVVEALQNSCGGYIGFRNIYFYDGALVKKPSPLSAKVHAIEDAAQRLNKHINASGDTEFFIYYIETDNDINFENNEKSNVYEYFKELIKLPADHVSCLSINSIEDYRESFLTTDHHWNGTGAYKGYRDICQMLGIPGLESKGLHSVYGRYLGTRASGVEGVAAEDFSVNIFEYPTMDITINGNASEDYGMQSLFIADVLESFSYGSVFGPDCAEIIFDTGIDGKNLLIMGDSYDNAIVKALAADFAKTYCIDLRAHDSFDLDAYIAEKQIDSVLFVGAMDYFSNTLF